jgi:hypothetical protein
MDTATSLPGFPLVHSFIAGASLLIGSRFEALKIPIAVKISPCVIRTLRSWRT